MSFETAIRTTEILLALAFIQQSLEHLEGPKEQQRIFLPRIMLSVLLILGISAPWVCILLLIHGIMILRRFDGPYNGGADRMSLLILACLCLIYFIPSLKWQEYIFGYLALQVILSYFISGVFKVINPEWWTGQALQDLFRFSAFPVSEALRAWANCPRVFLCIASWLAILFELLFPLVLLNQSALLIGLCAAIVFHLGNIYLFGFNRFLWVWLAAYPSVIWLQGQLVSN